MPALHIQLLGDYFLMLDDAAVATVTIPRVQSLLAYLVLLARAEAIGALHNNGMLLGQRAWLAWRADDLPEAEPCGRLSLDEKNQQKMEMNIFQWAGRWPLPGSESPSQRL